MHKPIQINHLGLSFPHKTCFGNFSARIAPGGRIAVIGRNGSGKTTLLRMLQGSFEPTRGEIRVPSDVVFGYVPQTIEEFETLSGGQRLNAALTRALGLHPNVLLLDEPTNHLDRHNRKSLMRMLRAFDGTLIVVSHDTELLRNCIDTLWHIDDGRIHVFTGSYDDFFREKRLQRASIERELSRLDRQKKDMHQALMKEQVRAAKSKAGGKRKVKRGKWPTIVIKGKVSQGETTTGRKRAVLDEKKDELIQRLSDLRLPEVILPKFSIDAAEVGDKVIVSVAGGAVGYPGRETVLRDIVLSVGSRDRIEIQGDNGSGKTTLLRALRDDPRVVRSGDWRVLKAQDIGALDQHYATLDREKTALETIVDLVPAWPHAEIRRHLNDFLFRKNEEVNRPVHQLSGGEKARLSLARIAARTPKLLLLDEITNNIDLETRGHVIEVLKAYPGALIVISHDPDFLKEIGVVDSHIVREGRVKRR